MGAGPDMAVTGASAQYMRQAAVAVADVARDDLLAACGDSDARGGAQPYQQVGAEVPFRVRRRVCGQEGSCPGTGAHPGSSPGRRRKGSGPSGSAQLRKAEVRWPRKAGRLAALNSSGKTSTARSIPRWPCRVDASPKWLTP